MSFAWGGGDPPNAGSTYTCVKNKLTQTKCKNNPKLVTIRIRSWKPAAFGDILLSAGTRGLPAR